MVKPSEAYSNLVSFMISGLSENRTRKAYSSVDVRNMDDSVSNQGSTSKRRRFFSSFRKKIRSSKYRDQNENLTSLSTSQPNIFHTSSQTTSTDDEFHHRSWINQSSVDKSVSDLDMSPTRSRSQSYGRTSSEEWDKVEIDSGIAVIETTASTDTVRFISFLSPVANPYSTGCWRKIFIHI